MKTLPNITPPKRGNRPPPASVLVHASWRVGAVLGMTALFACGSDVQVSAASAAGSSAAETSSTAGSGGAATSTGMGTTGTMGAGGDVVPAGAGGAGANGAGSGGAGAAAGGGGVGGGVGGGLEGPGDTLDPSEIYLLGTLSEGACYLDALATWSNPQAATVGFDCYFDNEHAMIRPTDGRIIYTNTFEDLVREFHCDECTYTASYPQDPLANDAILSTLPCGPDGFYSLRFKVGPGGDIIHTCIENPLVWYDEAGAVVYDDAGDALLHLGFGGRALTLSRVVDLATKTYVDVTGLPYKPIETVRALPPDGFWVVIDQDPMNSAAQELWQIDVMGVATLVGAYPALPAGYSVKADSGRLDASGNLFQLGQKSNSFTDVIFRRQVGGISEIVYTEESDPLVKVHISSLVTGP